MPIDNKELKKKLKSLSELIAKEAERNPEFDRAINLIFGIEPDPPKNQSLPTAAQPLPDPFLYYQTKGPMECKIWLEAMELADLKSIVRQHRFDPSRLSDRWRKKERFVNLIMERVHSRTNQGESFRHYGQRQT